MAQRSRMVGTRDLIKVFRRLPERAERRALRSAVGGAARLVAREARQNVNGIVEDGGISARDVKAEERRRERRPGRVVFGIGADKDKFYLPILELGAAPHEILAGLSRRRRNGASRGAALLADRERGIVFGTRVRHPGLIPRPWLRPALVSKRQEALREMIRRMGATVNKEAARLAGPLNKSGLIRRARRSRR